MDAVACISSVACLAVCCIFPSQRLFSSSLPCRPSPPATLSVYSLLTLCSLSLRAPSEQIQTPLIKWTNSGTPSHRPGRLKLLHIPSETGVVIRSSNSKQNFRFLSSAKHNSYTNRKTLSKSTAGGRRAEKRRKKKKCHANPTEKSYTSTSTYSLQIPDTT